MGKTIRSKPFFRHCNKVGYFSFLMIAAGFVAARNFTDAMMYLGLAFIFDPFNSAVPFQQRPVYQRLLLLVHLVITIAVLSLMLLLK